MRKDGTFLYEPQPDFTGEDGFSFTLALDALRHSGAEQYPCRRYKHALKNADGVVPHTWWTFEEVGHNDEAKEELMAILPEHARSFSTPKPTRLLDRILQIGCDAKGIVLDIFAGSGTTGHAVLKANAADGGTRRFILVSNSEATAEEPDKNLCRDVCAERVRRVAQGYPTADGTEVSGLGGGFAYLRCRRMPVSELLDLDHPAVWTALQLRHLEGLAPYAAEAPFQWAEEGDTSLCYIPRFRQQYLAALRDAVAPVDESGQIPLFFNETGADGRSGYEKPAGGSSPGGGGGSGPFDDLFRTGGYGGGAVGGAGEATGGAGSPPSTRDGKPRRFTYPLRDDAPRGFQTQELSPDNETTEEDCAQRFIISTRALFEAFRSRVKVERKTLEVFSGQMQLELMGAELEPSEIEQRAMRALEKSPMFDPRELRRALRRKVEAVLREEFLDEANEPLAVGRMLDTLLALHPELLHDAQRSALAKHAMILPADPLPLTLESDKPLPGSKRNLYGIIPADLNSWDQDFVQRLDHETSDTVTWWHRNLPHKSWAVNVLLPDGRGFFPGFLVGVRNRKTLDGVLLAEPKFRFEQRDQVPKADVTHVAYGKVLVPHREGGVEWRVVRLDAKSQRPILGDPFRIANLAGWGL